MVVTINKWWAIFKTFFSQLTTYRMDFLLQFIGPSLVFFFIKYNLWSSIFESNGMTPIQGYTFNGMIQYHLWIFINSLVCSGHRSWNLSEEIRMGKISSYLIYPIRFWEFHTASFLSFQAIQFFVALATLLILGGMGITKDIVPMNIVYGFSFSFFVSFFWFTLQYFAGLIAFWLEETWIFRVILEIVTSFLSGAIIPLELYPENFVSLLKYTPFPYLAHYPSRVYMGHTEGMGMAIFIVIIWTVLFAFINSRLWNRGLKLYTAAGM